MPDPFSPNSGFGMNVAYTPYFIAISLTAMRYVIALSAISQPVGEAHVDLVLRRPDLVVRVLDVDAELLEREHRLAPQVRCGVERREVEVAAPVEHLRRPAVQLGLSGSRRTPARARG